LNGVPFARAAAKGYTGNHGRGRGAAAGWSCNIRLRFQQFGVALTAALLAYAGPLRAADPQGYSVSLTGVEGEIASVMRDSSQLFLLADAEPIPPFALVMRAREDVPRLRTVMDSFGYYQGAVALTVAGLSSEDPELP